MNGVPDADVCIQPADPQNAAGEFIHMEQAVISRSADAYDGWVAAINATFGASQNIVRSAL